MLYITSPQFNLFNPAAYFKLVLFLMQNTCNHRPFSVKKKISVYQSVSSYSRCQNNCKAICLNFNNIWYKKVLKRKNAEHYILYYLKNIIEFLKLEFNYLYLDNNAELLCHFEIFKRLWWYKYIYLNCFEVEIRSCISNFTLESDISIIRCVIISIYIHVKMWRK